MVKDRQAELRDWVETDIVGSMLISGSIKTKYTIYTEDIYNDKLRYLYRHIINQSNEHGSFIHNELMTNNITFNGYILELMQFSISTNIDTKCKWLIQK